MRFITITLLCLACLSGCMPAGVAERQKALRDETFKDLQSLVGKKIVRISGPEKPCIIQLEDGSMVSFYCAKYSLRVEVTKPTDDAQ